MPVRATTSKGSPAFRWGKRGMPHRYGHGTGRTAGQAAGLAVRDGQRRAARVLVRDLDRRTDGRRRRKRPSRRFGGRAPRFSDRLITRQIKLLSSRIKLMQSLFLRVAEIPRARLDAEPAEQFAALSAARDIIIEGADDDAIGLEAIAREIDEDVSAAVDRQVSEMMGRPTVSAFPSQGTIDGWVSDNVSLIKSIAQVSHDEIADIITEGMLNGTPARELGKEIERRFQVSQSRARFIARDQTAKLAGQINRERQTAHGITKYLWSSSGDERVRELHAELDGTIHEWSDPPVADERTGIRGHPGFVWGCRCDAEPVLPDDDEAELLAEAAAQKERELLILQQSPIVTGEIGDFNHWNAKRIRLLKAGARSAVGL